MTPTSPPQPSPLAQWLEQKRQQLDHDEKLSFIARWPNDRNTHRIMAEVGCKFVNELEAFLAQPSPHRAWQPIETAPKDGTRILIFDPAVGIRCVYWNPEFDFTLRDVGAPEDSEVEPEFRGAWTDDAVASFSYEEVKEYAPTHYMPLPAPPEPHREQEP